MTRVPSLVSALASALALVLVALPARAADDCPPGSKYVNQDGFSWCSPSVCANDTQCSPGETCAPFPLCMQIGTTNDKRATLAGDAGSRLIATQRCGPDKECPDQQTCSALSRCIPRSVADKLTAAPAKAASGAPASAKSSCGCAVPERDASFDFAALCAAALVAGALARRRIRRDPV